MSSYCRKCLDLGPAATLYPNDPSSYTGPARQDVATLRCNYLRFWVVWSQIQPEKPDPAKPETQLPGPGYDPNGIMASLDQQLAAAKADGKQILLTAWQFPQWANGTAGRSQYDQSVAWTDRVPSQGSSALPKDLIYGLPIAMDGRSALGADSYWGQWINFLYSRYRPNTPTPVIVPNVGRASIDFLEIVNEPNGQCWPQTGPSTTGNPWDPGPLSIDCAVAQMIQTAQAFHHWYNYDLYLVVPATDDTPQSDTRLTTTYSYFSLAVIWKLQQLSVPIDSKVIWSQHNYWDFLNNTGGSNNRAAVARATLLFNNWSGYRQDNGPAVWLTEGGGRLKQIESKYHPPNPGPDPDAGNRIKQAALMDATFSAMHSSTGLGAGVGMCTQYLLYLDPTFDCGLRDPAAYVRPGGTSAGTKREIYDHFAFYSPT